MSVFLAFTGEAEERVGVENANLLADIDAALNSSARHPRFLDVTEPKARELAREAGVDEARYFSYLAFLHELEYRREFGPAMWERKSGVVPCPDWMPPTSGQMRAGRMPFYRLLTRLWNWALIVVAGGVFPLVILPLCGLRSVASGGGGARLGAVSVAMMCIWGAALAVFAACYAASRALRTRTGTK